MAAKMTAEMWRIGARNVLIGGLIVLVLMGGGSLAVSLLSDQSFEDALETVFDLLWITVFAMVLICWIWGRSASGKLLLECGSGHNRVLFMLVAVMFAIHGVRNWGALDHGQVLPDYMFWFSCALFFIIIGLGRVQIREKGIWQNGYLLKWEKIQSYEWSGQAQGAFKVQLRSRFPFAGGVLLIPDEHKDACCRYLGEHGVARI
jgi:hypothetical protein